MLYLAKCPLRISLAGGSTDLQAFIQKYGVGSVISFPSDVHVSILVHNNNRNKYLINYSRHEEADTIEQIENDIARVVLEHFKAPPVTVSFMSTIVSVNSGLSVSTAYTISLIKAMLQYTNKHMTDFEICDLALKLERKFNPLTGYQDAYGSGIGGFKRIDFKKNKSPVFTFLDGTFLSENFDMALYHTGISRNSTVVLETILPEKCLPLLDNVDEMEKAINFRDRERFLEIFNSGWETKKKTSISIAGNKSFENWDTAFKENPNVFGIKLCGAGGGGYFLALCEKGLIPKCINEATAIPIRINENGVVGTIF